MQSQASTPEQYLNELSEPVQSAMRRLRDTIKAHIPEGFEEGMGYGMMGYAVPHKLYPAGYHCNPKQALPFAGIAAQKNFIAVYHMGIYASEPLLNWFREEHAKASAKKLDMGKSCIRYKKPEDIPYELIGQLFEKMNVQQWVELYESNLKRKR